MQYSYAQFYPRLFGARPKLPGEVEGINYDGGYMADMLMAVRGLFIKEKTDWEEILLGVELENTYSIMDIDEQRGATLFKAKEKSSCCSRNFTSGESRPFNIKIENQLDRDRICIWLEKPQTCTILCANRPTLEVYVVNETTNAKIYLGKVIDPYDFCEFSFEVRDHNDQIVYTLHTPKCQQAMLCPTMPCNECKKVDFDVRDAAKNSVTIAKRRGKGLLSNLYSDADLFELNFTPTMPWNHRVLLFSTILFIDFMMFDTNASDAKR
jgi:Scramblase